MCQNLFKALLLSARTLVHPAPTLFPLHSHEWQFWRAPLGVSVVPACTEHFGVTSIRLALAAFPVHVATISLK